MGISADTSAKPPPSKDARSKFKQFLEQASTNLGESAQKRSPHVSVGMLENFKQRSTFAQQQERPKTYPQGYDQLTPLGTVQSFRAGENQTSMPVATSNMQRYLPKAVQMAMALKGMDNAVDQSFRQ